MCLSTRTYCLDTMSFSLFFSTTSNLPDKEGLIESILSALITSDLEARKNDVPSVSCSNSYYL